MDALLVVALVVPWILLAFETWIIYLLLRQQGRTLVAQEAVAQQLAGIQAMLAGQAAPQAPAAPEGLEVGTPAPEFELPDLDGRPRKLEEFVGEPTLVAFWSTTCGFCQQMAPELGKLPDGAPRVILISRGDADEHRALAEEHGWNATVVLEEGWDVSSAYKSGGTPTGYLLDAEGQTATPLLIGQQQLLDAVNAYASQPASGNGAGDLAATLEEKTRQATERARAAGLAVREMSESRIGREGLKAGTQAPEFTLTDIEGEERSLADFRGRRVLLVFSDVDCKPCEALLPKLAKLHRERSDVEVVVVSRGELDENREKAEAHGLTCPILLQRSWEISKQYEMFGTPIGYLIDENGVVEKDCAVGADEIEAIVPPAPNRRQRRRARARR